jgi:oligosaccharide translocation protein RFT1
MLLSLMLGILWLNPNVLDVPSDKNFADQYQLAVKLICVACVLDLCGEPFWVVSQVYMYIKFRASVELFYTLTRAVLMAIVVYISPESAILAWGWSTLIVSLGIPVINVVFYHNLIRQQNIDKKKLDTHREPDDSKVMPFTSVKDIFPHWTAEPKLHKERFYLMSGFFKQGLLKQILTEGEAYMFTFFNLMSLAEQGVYNVASQFGSLAGRLIFSKVEEAAYFYFSQTVTRGPITKEISKQKEMEEKASIHLYKLLRAMILVGLVVAVYAQSYSHMLLHLYGGETLSSGMGPGLLRSQSFFLLFMAVNGVSECYAFASMTTQQVEKYKYLMFLMTCIFLICVYGFAKILGPVGFVVANCCNFAMRIFYNFHHIYHRHQEQEEKPWKGVIPPKIILVILFFCGCLCKVSEMFLYDNFASYQGAFYHFLIGLLCFLITVICIVFNEKFIKEPALIWFSSVVSKK